MKIKSIRIQNFRSFEDETIELSPYTSFVGANGAGKSTVLVALNVFFREFEYSATEVRNLSIEDFHNKDTSKPVEITVTFNGLNDSAKEDFKHYFRQGELVLTARCVLTPENGVAVVKHFGQRNIVKAFAPFFVAIDEGKTVDPLRKIYEQILGSFPNLPVIKTKDGMTQALRDFEEAHPELCELEPSSKNLYGFSGGADKFNKHVQWVYVPAVRDAAGENVERKNTALGKLLSYTVRSTTSFDKERKEIEDAARLQYKELMQSKQGALDKLSQSLTKRLGDWAHPGATAKLQWSEDEKTSISINDPNVRLLASEGGFEGELTRFGNGFQRSYLLVLLQELAAVETANAPTLIFACEEPELFQHPPQARHLAQVFQSLSDGNAQVIVTTHSPYFVAGQHFESVRFVRRGVGQVKSHVKMCAADKAVDLIANAKSDKKKLPIPAQQARLHQALQPHLSEMFFANKVVLVEGIEDVAYLTSWLIASAQWVDCRRHGLHLVPVNGKGNLLIPIVLGQELGIPIFAMFDGDCDVTHHRSEHENDNKELLMALGGDTANPFPPLPVFAEGFIQWSTEIGKHVREEVGEEKFQKALAAARIKLGKPEGNFLKNPILIGELASELFSITERNTYLDKACAKILEFARK